VICSIPAATLIRCEFSAYWRSQSLGHEPCNLLGPDRTGPGGIGDYSRANGNTPEVVNAAHSIWKGDWDKPPAGAVDAGEFDLVEAT
jgi:hypothetical protein